MAARLRLALNPAAPPAAPSGSGLRSPSARCARFALACLLALAACGGGKAGSGPSFNPVRQFTEVNEDQERDLGMQFDAEVGKHLQLVDDPVVLSFMNDLGNEILKKIPQQPFIYRFRVVKDPTLNAFAVPGGYIYFHSGTILAAGSVDELAGVMSHEIGHVKGRHYARMREKSAIPELLATLAGVGAAVATGKGEAAVAAQGINQALQLHFSREFENEADQLGMDYMTRAGYDTTGMSRFFERIVALEKKQELGFEIPPYLYSHPDVKDRIGTVALLAPKFRPQVAPDPSFEPRLREVQARLAVLEDARRSSMRPPLPPKPASSDLALSEADRLVQAGQIDAALGVLGQGEDLSPADPRLPYRRAELLEQAGRRNEAIAEYRHTVALDPQQAMVLYKLGLAYKAAGDKRNAVFYLEQAANRFGERSALEKTARWEIFKLTFKAFDQSGLSDGSDESGADTVAGYSRDRFKTSDDKAVWWGRLNSRFSEKKEKLRARWKDPSGDVRRDEALVELSSPVYMTELAIREEQDMEPGSWTVEVLLEDDVVESKTFKIDR